MSVTLKDIFQYDNRFYETYYNPQNIIQANSPELVFMNAICHGDFEHAISLFHEQQLFGCEKSYVDAPQGRFEGLAEIRQFAENWLSYAEADDSWVEPVIQTQSGGRSCTEMIVNFKYYDWNKTIRFPICVVGDLRGKGGLDAVRIYFFFKWIPNLSAYRPRIFKPSYNQQAELNLMCGVIREYIDSLTNLHDESGVDRIMNTMADDVIYGGYRPQSISGVIQGKELVRKKYWSFVNLPTIIRFESIIDNGITTVSEWVGVPRDDYTGDPGRKPLTQSGVGIYDRDPVSGKLKAIRIIDSNFPY